MCVFGGAGRMCIFPGRTGCCENAGNFQAFSQVITTLAAMPMQYDKHTTSDRLMQLWSARNPTAMVTDLGEVTCGLFSCLSARCSCHKQRGLQSKQRLGDGGEGGCSNKAMTTVTQTKALAGKE